MPRHILAAIRYHRRPLLAFHLYFALLSILLLAPFSAWLLAGLIHLTGSDMIGNEELLLFAINPVGVLWLLLSATLAAMLIFLQHAGMMLIATRDARGRFHTAAGALWVICKRLPQLLKLSGMQVAAHLALLAPVLLLLAWAFEQLLGGYDIYFVVNNYPPELWQFLALLIIAGIVVALVNGSLYLRWILALPVMLLENLKPIAALKRSAELTCGARRKIAFTVLSIAGVVATIPLLVSFLFDNLGWLIFQFLPPQHLLVLAVIVGLLFSYALVNLAAGFLGVSVNSLLILKLYHRRCKRNRGVTIDDEPRHVGYFAVGIEAVLVIFAVVQVVVALQVFSPQDDVLNIAHRGNAWDTPENTEFAIKRAIADGAHYVELDVRHTADGELVILHDRDLLRIAGDRRPIWQIQSNELADLDVGSWFRDDFRAARILTLAEAVELLRGRAGLYLEIKGAPQMPNLVAKVMAELDRLEFTEETVIASLAGTDLLQAKAINADIRTSLLVHTSVGRVEGQPFNTLALRQALVTPSRLNRIRQYDHELHVWTLNDSASMARMVDFGVDGIITDRPDLLAAVLEERAEMSTVERWLYRLKHWIW
ncbi:glycerophosphodiester phosphodiesterase family protein [Aliidiomarina iranensis]|nr:glycerophosphodiester phosphodiesterase family protein [Aliidiomarina iranensis]